MTSEYRAVSASILLDSRYAHRNSGPAILLTKLCGVFLAQPREMLLMDQSGLLTEVMSPTSPLSVQMEPLRCWRDVLLVRLQQETDAVQIHTRSSPTHPRLRNNSDGRSSN
jgi:hypothetical protein